MRTRVFILLCVVLTGTALPADFYVATDGNDAWSGTLASPADGGNDGPFATLAHARDAVRDVKGRDVTVQVRGGTYRLKETVVFSAADSAGKGRTVTYAAHPGESPVFSSAFPITGWHRLERPPEALPEPAHGHVWVASVAGHPAMRTPSDGRSPRFFTLFDNGRRVPRARGKGFSQTNRTPRESKDYTTVTFPRGAVHSYANLQSAELVVIPMHFWILNILPIASIDEQKLTLKTAQPGTYPLGKSGMTDRPTAWVENVLEVLDEPGEWMLDSAAERLYYWPRDGKAPQSVSAPTLTELVRVEGKIAYEGATDEPVMGLGFRGLTFAGGDRLPWHGRTGWGLQHDWELFDKPTALLRLRGAEGCHVQDCAFRDSGHTAVRLDLHCIGNNVFGNHIHDIGGVGVLLAGYGPGTKDVNRGNSVHDNHIHHIGQVYWGSAAVFAWQSGDNWIAHNLIHHVPYNGINITGRIHHRVLPGPGECSRTVRWHETPEKYRNWGWRDREPYLHARKNLVSHNDIHHVMEALGDGNCVYVSGAGGSNIVHHNFCHDCNGKYMNAVIRCDDDQHETLIVSNVCARTRGHGEGFISKGDNDIVNNVVADLRPNNRHRGYLVFPYGSVKDSRIERNILLSCRPDQNPYWQSKQPSRGRQPGLLRDTDADHNLYHCTVDPQWAAAHLEKERRFGIEKDSRSDDPLFRDINANDFGFKAGSPATAMGIEPIDVSEAGLRPEYRERLLGRTITTRIDPAGGLLRGPVAVTITADIEGAAVHYTLDGRQPTTPSPVYRAPFKLARAALVRARSFAPDAADWMGAAAEFTEPPHPIAEDFESATVGLPAPGSETSEDAKLGKYAARVTDQLAAAGKRCLRFTDGPGQERSYDPHVVYRCRFTEGQLTGRFDIRIDAEATLSYQWRQYDGSFVRGPSVRIDPGGRVTQGGKTLLTLPSGQWVRFEVACELGSGTFHMRARLPDGSERTFNELKHDGAFRRLDWVGLVANGTRETTFYVDNIYAGPR
jgi:hypothetical protein